MTKFKILSFSVLFLIHFSSSFSHAGFWGDHLKPSIEDGFDWKGLTIIGSGLAALAVVQPYDTEIRDANRNSLLSDELSDAGDIMGTGLVGATIALSQLVFDDYDQGTAHFEAILYTGVTTQLLKYANQRGRPNSNNRMSMPSAHTSTAFATATSLAYSYGWKAAIPGYALATLVAMSRVNDDAHWTSDTIMGAAIGIFWGRATSFHHVGITPAYFDGGAGLQFAHSF